MGKKTFNIKDSGEPKAKKALGSGAIFAILGCIFAAALLGFAAAERLGFTGTQFLFKVSPGTEENDKPEQKRSRETAHEIEVNAAGETEKKSDRSRQTEPTDSSRGKKSQSDSGKKKTTSKKSAKKSASPDEPLPLHAFIDISRKPHTWPGFIRLTRSRTISMTDPRTGEPMGRMEVPEGTVVKVFKVLPTGTLEVADRTGQKFKVEASGTNFAAAYALVKNKPKKKSKPKKVIAQTPEKPAGTVKSKATAESAKKEKSASTPVMSAFGVVVDDSDEDDWEDDSDEE